MRMPTECPGKAADTKARRQSGGVHQAEHDER